MPIRFNSKTKASVSFKVEVIGRDGKVRQSNPWQKNLILDQGLDKAGTTVWCDLFKVAVAGTGELTVKRDSGSTTFSRSGSTVTASASFFGVLDVGRILKFDSGEEMRVVTYLSPTSVAVDSSGTIAASPGTLWYANSTALINEVKRTSTVSTALGANSTIVTDNSLRFKRTFRFSAEVGTVTYQEIGWSWTATPGAGTLFGIAPMHGATVTLESGEILQVIVQLNLVLTPGTPTLVGDVGSGGFDTSGTAMIESLGSAISQVDTSGNTVVGNTLEPTGALTARALLSNWTQSPEMVTSALNWGGVTNTGITMTLQAYSPGSNYRELIGTFSVTQANGTLYGLGFDNGPRTFSLKFSTPQTKANTHTLTLTFRRTWDRALDNDTES